MQNFLQFINQTRVVFTHDIYQMTQYNIRIFCECQQVVDCLDNNLAF